MPAVYETLYISHIEKPAKYEIHFRFVSNIVLTMQNSDTNQIMEKKSV